MSETWNFTQVEYRLYIAIRTLILTSWCLPWLAGDRAGASKPRNGLGCTLSAVRGQILRWKNIWDRAAGDRLSVDARAGESSALWDRWEQKTFHDIHVAFQSLYEVDMIIKVCLNMTLSCLLIPPGERWDCSGSQTESGVWPGVQHRGWHTPCLPRPRLRLLPHQRPGGDGWTPATVWFGWEGSYSGPGCTPG